MSASRTFQTDKAVLITSPTYIKRLAAERIYKNISVQELHDKIRSFFDSNVDRFGDAPAQLVVSADHIERLDLPRGAKTPILKIAKRALATFPIEELAFPMKSGDLFEISNAEVVIASPTRGTSINWTCLSFCNIKFACGYPVFHNSRLINCRAVLKDATFLDSQIRDSTLKFTGTNLALKDTNFTNCHIRCDSLAIAKLENVKLHRCAGIIEAANLSQNYVSYQGCKSLETSYDFMKKNFHYLDDGWIVFKCFENADKIYPNPESWKIKQGSVITEVCDQDRGNTCSYGISVGNFQFMDRYYPRSKFNACFIPASHGCGIVVPQHSNGKIRTDYLEILNEVKFDRNQEDYTVAVELHGNTHILHYDGNQMPIIFKKGE